MHQIGIDFAFPPNPICYNDAMYKLDWTDEKGMKWNIVIDKANEDVLKEYLNKVFHTAICTDLSGRIVGGVRPVKEHEKKRRNHKWFRWVNLNEEENDWFIRELEKL